MIARTAEARRQGASRRGVTRGDVIVAILLVVVAVSLALVGMGRTRENSRLAACSKNLMHIGFALSLYDQMHGGLPETRPPLAPEAVVSAGHIGPLKVLLEALDLPDLTELRDGRTAPEGARGSVTGEIPVRGFFCTADPNAISGQLQAPVSYRAVTGDTPRGDTGAFAPGHPWSLAGVEARDGLSYTAAFSERLVGKGELAIEGLTSYRIVPGPVSDAGCPPPANASLIREDAGSSWIASSYRSTLYNHALPPNGRPSCVASDGGTANMGASSGHVRGVNLLRLDGSVGIVVPTIDSRVWRGLATVGPLPDDATH